MPRRVRKVVLYVCTTDGSIHPTRAAAKARVAEMDARAKPKAKGKPVSRGGSWVASVMKAIDGGAKDARTIRTKTTVPPRLVHPTLSNLRKRGLVKGNAGSLALTREGRKRLGELASS